MNKIEFPAGMTANDLKFEKLIATLSGDYAYIAAGMLGESDLAGLASVLMWEMALEIAFDSLGELTEAPAKIESKTDGLKTRKYMVAGKRDNNLELRIAGVSRLQKAWLESPAFSETTVTIVLQNRDKDKITVFNGMKWVMDWSAETDGLYEVALSTDFTGSTGARVIALEGLPERGFDFVNGLDVFTARGAEPSQIQALPVRVSSGFVPVTATPPLGWIVSGEEAGILTSEPVVMQPGRDKPLRLQYIGADSGEKQAVMEFSATGMETQNLNLRAYRGSGTSGNAIPVGTAAELAAMADDLEAHYIQVADIDLAGVDWEPVGDDENRFTGSFDGNGFTIYDMCAAGGEAVGLFGEAQGAKLSRIRLRNACARGGRNVGLLLGNGKAVEIEFCEVEGRVQVDVGAARMMIGGLVSAMSGSILNSHAEVEIALTTEGPLGEEEHFCGGLAGGIEGSIDGCSARGMIRLDGSGAGGLVGEAQAGSVIRDSFALVTMALRVVSSGGHVGGFLGVPASSSVEVIRCWCAGKMKGTVGNGFAGADGFGSIFEDCAYCREVSHVAEKPAVAAALSLSEMYDQATWEELNYDFEEVWEMPGGGADFPRIQKGYDGE